VDRVFLDANVLFSTVYRPDSKFRMLWSFKEVELITSLYALAETQRNLQTSQQKKDLENLAKKMTILETYPDTHSALNKIQLHEKDVPILLGAIAAKATHLLTGDKMHFGKLYGKSIEGVLILPPAEYWKAKSL
jgi:predicted nucleic acid-binding protein